MRELMAVAVMIMLAAGMTAGIVEAQEKPKKPPKEKNAPKMKAEPAEQPQQVLPPGNDNELIDYRIAEMLAGWQIGDTNLLHSAYADDVSVVSGAYEPPILGWANFLATYQKLRARISTVQVDRRNTYTVVRGTLAWSSYQWEFSGVMDGSAAHWKGQTTLVLEKRAGKWMIVHNHTSVVPEAPAAAAPPVAPKP
ncbi:MAG: nuclear transport factor 2 family protein [Acidobacteria bacterium]|nr:nuclear transport factor 2 family protein [Acidobacteriota bacterium]